MNIPILRLGESYTSLDLVELDLGARGTLTTHTANPGLIRRDLLQISKAKAALDAIPAEILADYCEQAAELFLHTDLPCGDASQSPQDYIESLSALTRLPHTLVRMNMAKIHAAMSQIRTVIGGLTRQLPLEIFDKGLTNLSAGPPTSVGNSPLTVNYYPATTSLGVSLPSNAPAEMAFCEVSTSLNRTGPLASRSSLSNSAARLDILLNTLSWTPSSAPFRAMINSSDETSRNSAWIPRSSISARLSNTNIRSCI